MSADHTWWLVERDYTPTDKPQYLQATRASITGWEWTENPLEAVRFRRQRDAAAIVKVFFAGCDHRVVEYGMASAA